MRGVAVPALFLTTALLACGAPTPGPIIGIVGVPATEGCDSLQKGGSPPLRGYGSCFSDMYAKWLQQGGARTVAIDYDLSETPDLLESVVSSLSGFLFTGGGLDLPSPSPNVVKYMNTLGGIYRGVKRRYDAGEAVPLWGTCMGFQTLAILGAGGNTSVVEYNAFDSEDMSLPLDVTQAAASSRLLGKACPASIYKIATTWNVTSNLHHDGVVPSMFLSSPLKENFRLLATGTDRKGKAFGAVMEDPRYPIYAVQFHPERPQFEWTANHGFNHSKGSVEVMQYFANFFVEEARKNSQRLTDASVLSWAESRITDLLRTQPAGDAFGNYRWIVY